MDSQKIKALMITVLVIFAATYLGITAATEQLETIAWVLGGTTLMICLMLGKKIWLLLPFLGSLGLTFQIPGQPDTFLIAQCLFIGFSTLHILIRRLPVNIRITELEIWMILLTMMVGQVFLRNPVGLNIFGSSSVGARPYAVYGITLCTAVLLSIIRIPPQELKTALKLSIIGGIMNFFISLTAWFVPTLGYYLGGGQTATQSNDPNEVIDPNAATRIGFLGALGGNLSLWISSFKSPLRACIHPFWAPLILISLVAGAMSGFRNTIAAIGLNFLLGLWYRGGFTHVVVSALIGITGLILITIVNVVTPLPPNIQRALSFLPGTWEERYVLDAENSTEWRFEIWREVMLTDRWIHDKWLGDGLGFTAAELEYQRALLESKRNGIGISGFDAHRESILANGDYHSGPISTIRTIGYIGLTILLLAQIRLCVYAHRQIKRARDTEWFPVTLFICIPIIWNPLFFILIFGGFAGASSGLLVAIGMVRLLENNLPLPVYEKTKPYIPKSLAQNVSRR